MQNIFCKKYDAKKALEVDLKFCEKLFIRTLPTFLIEFDGEAKIFSGLLSYENFAEIIVEMMQKNLLNSWQKKIY